MFWLTNSPPMQEGISNSKPHKYVGNVKITLAVTLELRSSWDSDPLQWNIFHSK